MSNEVQETADFSRSIGLSERDRIAACDLMNQMVTLSYAVTAARRAAGEIDNGPAVAEAAFAIGLKAFDVSRQTGRRV